MEVIGRLLFEGTPYLQLFDKSCRVLKEALGLPNHVRLAQLSAVFAALRDPAWAAYAIRDLIRVPQQQHEDHFDRAHSGILCLFRMGFLLSSCLRMARRLYPHELADRVIVHLTGVAPYFAIFFSTHSALSRADSLIDGSTDIRDGTQLFADIADVSATMCALTGVSVPAAALLSIASGTGTIATHAISVAQK